MSKRTLPTVLPISNPPTYQDQLQWYEDRVGQLENLAIDMIQDRVTLADRCK